MSLLYKVVKQGISSVENIPTLEYAYQEVERLKEAESNYLGQSIAIYSYNQSELDFKLVEVLYFQLPDFQFTPDTQGEWMGIQDYNEVFYQIEPHLSFKDDYCFIIRDAVVLFDCSPPDRKLVTITPAQSFYIHSEEWDSEDRIYSYSKKGYLFSSIEQVEAILPKFIDLELKRTEETIVFFKELLFDLNLSPAEFLRKRTHYGQENFSFGGSGILYLHILFNGEFFFIDLTQNFTSERINPVSFTPFRSQFLPKLEFSNEKIQEINQAGVAMTRMDEDFCEYVFALNLHLYQSENDLFEKLSLFMEYLKNQISMDLLSFESKIYRLKNLSALSLVDFR